MSNQERVKVNAQTEIEFECAIVLLNI